jgi:hypothetical protein
MDRGFTRLIASVAVALVAASCANKGFPEGGPKDEAPPVVVAERPASFTTGFNQKRLNIYFNEYVQLREINTKFIMSPPARKNARVNLRGKYVMVEFQDTLRPETTYSLDFGNAIVDNNEGNPLGFYRYVFSTGSVIDTMEVAGRVIDVQTRLPLLGVTVMLHGNPADSSALKDLPDYIARTDSSGVFRVTNVGERPYRVMVVDDANRDNMFTPGEEKVGFLDSLVTPVVWHETRMDTIRPDTTRLLLKRSKKGEITVENLSRDTIVEREHVLFGPSNLLLVMFEEEKKQLYMTGQERKERERLDFTFSIPRENNLEVVPLEGETPADWYLTERSAGHDTLSLWIRDSSIYKRDSLSVELAYLYTDSLQQLVTRRDTVLLAFTERKKEESKRKAKKEDEEEQPALPEMKFLGVTSLAGNPHDLHRPVVLDFDKPVEAAGLEAMILQEKVDSTWRQVPYRLEQDSLKIRRFRVEHAWKPGTGYRLAADSMTIYSIYGLYNKALEVTFVTKTLDAYGKILVNATGVTGPVIFQLCQGDKEVKVVEERHAERDGRVAFEYLKEGTYTLRVVIDANGNGKWDTGEFLQHRQPEEIKYLPEEFNVKQNFDIEQDVAVDKEYPREDPAKKKKEEGNKNTPGR